MASALENFDSMEGQSVGIFGHLSATRLFAVQTDNETDLPEVVIQSGVGASSVPQGSPHPNNKGLVALQFTRGRRINDKAWFVIVVYGPPVFFPTATGEWDIRITGHLETEEPLHDLDGKLIATPWYEPLPIPLNPLGYVGKESGIQLRPTLPPKQFPFSRHRRGGQIILSRDYPNFPNPLVTEIAGAMNTINSTTFRLKIRSVGFVTIANARQLLLTSWDVTSIPGVLVGQSVVGEIWRVVATVNYSEVPWSPLVVRHRYEFEGLHEDVKGPDDQVVTSSFRVYHETNFTSIFKR